MADIVINADLGLLKTAASDFKAWETSLDGAANQLQSVAGGLAASWQDANSEKRHADLQKATALIRALQEEASKWDAILNAVISNLEKENSRVNNNPTPNFPHI